MVPLAMFAFAKRGLATRIDIPRVSRNFMLKARVLWIKTHIRLNSAGQSSTRPGIATSVREGQAMGHVYGKEFMEDAAASSRYAAEKIVHHLKSDLSPRSILDVGCAVGAWLDVWMRAGISDVCGVDGDYVNRSHLLIPQDRFRAATLAETIDLGRRYDLVQSLEVGEHITPSAARIFVD